MLIKSLTIGMICCRSFVSSEILRLPACSKFDGQFSVEISGKVLAESTVSRLPGIAFVECVFQCISHKKCKSVNFSEQKSDCELNSKDSRDKNITFKESDGWSYFETASGPVQNFGPHCLHFQPCKYGVCRDICEEPGYVCLNGYLNATTRCESPSGSSAQSAAKSCYEIRTKCGAASPPSGRYWIMASFPIQMYCDMDVEGGGWTKVGNVKIASNSFWYSPSYVHDGIDTLNDTEKSYYALSTAGLAKLHEIINFTSIRIYCYKPSVNRTLHIYTANNQSGMAVVNYMIGKDIVQPASCKSFVRLSDDTSYLSQSCSNWYEGKWSYSNAKKTEVLYDITAYIFGKSHVIVGSYDGRFECDDMLGEKIGTWMFFVR